MSEEKEKKPVVMKTEIEMKNGKQFRVTMEASDVISPGAVAASLQKVGKEIILDFLDRCQKAGKVMEAVRAVGDYQRLSSEDAKENGIIMERVRSGQPLSEQAQDAVKRSGIKLDESAFDFSDMDCGNPDCEVHGKPFPKATLSTGPDGKPDLKIVAPPSKEVH